MRRAGRAAGIGRSLHGEPADYPWGAHEVAPGAVAYFQPNGGLGEANVGLVVADGESVVIDTCWDHAQAGRMLDAVAAWTERAPIATIVNTHSNGDHWWGNAVMPEAAPVIATEAAAAAMRTESLAGLVALQAGLRVAGHLPVPGSLRHRIQDGAHELAPFEFASVRRRFPDVTFSGRRYLKVAGGRRVELVEVEPAHTSGDLMVFDHDSGTVFAGDLLFIGQTPIMWAGPAANWIRALEELVAFAPDVIVPGHGPRPTMGDVRTHIAYWSWVSEAVADQHRQGATIEEAALHLLRSPTFCSGPWAQWRRPETLAASVAAQYRHLDGRAGPLRPHHMVATMVHVLAVGDALATGGSR